MSSGKTLDTSRAPRAQPIYSPAVWKTNLPPPFQRRECSRETSLVKRSRFKWQLDRLVERRKDILLRLTTLPRRRGRERERERERSEGVEEKGWRGRRGEGGKKRRERIERTSSGLAGGNNRLRGFESSPTSSHKLSSVSRWAEGTRKRGNACGRKWRKRAARVGGKKGKTRARRVEGGLRGDDFTRRGTTPGLHASRWPCR